MIQDAKALIVVLVLTAPIWYLAKRLFAPLSAPGDFERRRNVWIFLTVVGMLAPNIWLYAFFALPVAYWAGRRDSNPVAVYLLLFYVVPNASVPLPSIIVNQLFDINNQRLLALAIILPAVLQARRLRFSEPGLASAPRRRLDAMDWLLISYLLLTLILPFPYESITNTMRRALLALLDVGLLFAVWSRLNPRYEVFRDCMGAWVLAALMMSMVAMFETARGWLLYVPITHGVLFPLFSQIGRDEPERLAARYYQIRLRSDVLTVLPIGVIAASSQQIVDLLFDDRYAAAGWMLQALCVRAAMTCLLAPVETYLFAVGQTRYGFYRDLARAAWILPGIPIAWALGGVPAVVWVVALGEIPVMAVLWFGFHRLGCMRWPRELIGPAVFLAGFGLALLFWRATAGYFS